jgi:hypothetical protein
MLPHWRFIAARWDDSPYDEFPSVYKELVLRIDPFASADPYANLMGDGYGNLQKMQNNMDPFQWYAPPPPNFQVKFQSSQTNFERGNAILTWEHLDGPEPEYYLIERTLRKLRPMTNLPYARPGMPRPGVAISNRPPFRPRVPPFRPGQRLEDLYISEPPEIVAKVPTKPGLRDYKFIDQNVDTLAQPSYRMRAEYSPPLHAYLDRVDAQSIRGTLIHARVKPGTNGYDLTIEHPIEHADYLLLVRDKNAPQWRASGYFTSGATRQPIQIKVDKQGMMTSPQNPIAMPAVKFAPVVSEPEFVAGWGEDSDGDGLPDIYEVLVTDTAPDNADTGNTGILDGYKDLALDGWTTLEKFRRRLDPQKTASPPPPVVLIKPTPAELFAAVTAHSDLRFALQLEVRTNNTAPLQSIEQVPWLMGKVMSFQDRNTRKPFDVRVSWYYSETLATDYANPQDPASLPGFASLQSLSGKINLKLFESFQARLTNGPPLSPQAVSNLAVTIEKSYRAGEIDKGVAMAEIMVLKNNQAQDFYGKVVDQYGQPVSTAEVSLQVHQTEERGGTFKTQTDAKGLFQFTGIRGESLSVIPSKAGYQIEGHGLGTKGQNGPETKPDQRMVYTMWKLKGPEPMIHKEFASRKIIPDGRTYTIDLLKNEIVEGTNGGDLRIRIHRPPNLKPREKFDWTFAMQAVDGGFIEVTNDIYLNEAPASGYLPEYGILRHATDVVNYATRELYRTDRTFFLKSRGGQLYGHFKILELDPDFRSKGMAVLRLDYYVTPAGSRNLEFDPAKQIP